jgi:hypothetical protein
VPPTDPIKLKAYRLRQARKAQERTRARRAERIASGEQAVIDKRQADQLRSVQAKGTEASRLAPRSGLPVGAVKTIAALRHRLPDDASPEMVEVAGYAFTRMVDVLAGKVPARKAPQVLNAAREIRAELCGPVQQKIQMSGGMTLEMLVAQASQEPDEITVPALPPEGSEVQ